MDTVQFDAMVQRLEQQILEHDPALGVAHSMVRGLAPERPVGNLPALAVELVGRELPQALPEQLAGR